MIKNPRLYTTYDFVCVSNDNPLEIVFAGSCMAFDLPKIVSDMDSLNCRVMIVRVYKTPHRVFSFERYSK